MLPQGLDAPVPLRVDAGCEATEQSHVEPQIGSHRHDAEQCQTEVEMGVPRVIIHWNRVSPYKPTILGILHFWKPPNLGKKRRKTNRMGWSNEWFLQGMVSTKFYWWDTRTNAEYKNTHASRTHSIYIYTYIIYIIYIYIIYIYIYIYIHILYMYIISIYISIHLSIHLSIYLSIYLSMYVSMLYMYTCLQSM